MPTATLLIEIVIIGLFANLNLSLLIFFHTPQEWKLVEAFQSLVFKEGIATLLLFGAALGSYVTGVIVNVIVNNLFDPIDDYVRECVFDDEKQKELGDIDAWIKKENRKVSEIYHYMRYCLYSHGETMKEQLDQHRSEIRILRATALNSYWLMVVLVFRPFFYTAGMLDLAAVLTVLGLFVAMVLFTAWRLPALQPPVVKKWDEETKENVSRRYQRFFAVALILPWVVWVVALAVQRWLLLPGGWAIVWWLLGPLIALLVAVGSYMLWKKQQRRFYEALYHGFRALAVNRELGREPAKGIS